MTKAGIIRGRLAPSPTGFLHLGNAWSFLLAWLANRKEGGHLLLRIDDIDPVRSKIDFLDAILADLKWLGLDWDEICFQGKRKPLYDCALKIFEANNLIYKCFCTRKELRLLANAPHPGDIGAPYPGICRYLPSEVIETNMAQGKPWSLRFKTGAEPVIFNDLVQGRKEYFPKDIGGDFALKRSDGIYAYQLACAVDDGLAGINQIVRGKDLLPSTGRQLLLLKALGFPEPSYAHIPLLLDKSGERLAKRHKSLSLASLQEYGIKPEQVTGFLGLLAGINPTGMNKPAGQLVRDFALSRIPAKDITLNENVLPKWLKAVSLHRNNCAQISG